MIWIVWNGAALLLGRWLELPFLMHLTWGWLSVPFIIAFLWFEVVESRMGFDRTDRGHNEYEKFRDARMKKTQEALKIARKRKKRY